MTGNNPSRSTATRALLVIAMFLSSCASAEGIREPTAFQQVEPAVPAQVGGEPLSRDNDGFATGFLDFPLQWDDDESFDAGFSMYVAAWEFQQTYPGPSYQTGLPGTWLWPTNLGGFDGEDLYSTIEGGLGWWNDTRFATETPKFTMGGVARGFSEWANGPGAGAGFADVDRRDWDTPQGKYGAAQLSPYVLWAPDGLNIAQGTHGELFGYGYHPLPLLDPQTNMATAGVAVATGNRSWTLFLSTGNFQGPVSFFLPNFFSKPVLAEPELDGAFFDSSPMDSHRSVAMETQVIPAAQVTAADGVTYVRITPMQFPASGPDSSIILNQVASYTGSAGWEPATDWFQGEAPAPALFDSQSTRFSSFDDIGAAEGSSYTMIYDGVTEDTEYPIDWAALAEIDVSDPLTFRYRWNLDLVKPVGDYFVLPDYYRLDQAGDGFVWTPVAEAAVPESTGLRDHVFRELGLRNDTEPFTTPQEPDSIWKSPGPVAGPFRAELGDGSVVTYSWYRFIDQPAILHWDFSEEERGALQARVEQIHREWGPQRDYLAPPSVGELADLDPAIIVQPPAGLEVGYVPIVTRQEQIDR